MDSYTAKRKSGAKSVNLEMKQCIVYKHSMHKYVLSVKTTSLGHTEIQNPHLCCTGTVSALKPYFNPFYINFELKYLVTWLSMCSLKTVGSELLRWQRFKMVMILMFKIFQHVCLNMSADRFIHLIYILGKVN